MSMFQQLRVWLQGKKTNGVSVAMIVYIILQAWQSLELDMEIMGGFLAALGMTIGAKVDRKPTDTAKALKNVGQ